MIFGARAGSLIDKDRFCPEIFVFFFVCTIDLVLDTSGKLNNNERVLVIFGARAGSLMDKDRFCPESFVFFCVCILTLVPEAS